MKVIFEAETEIGLCDPDRIDDDFGTRPGNWIVVGQTTAAVTGPKGMVRIEQSCCLRSAELADDVRPQSWLPADITFEPALNSKEATKRLLQQLHEQYAQRIRQELMQRSLISPPGVFSVA